MSNKTIIFGAIILIILVGLFLWFRPFSSTDNNEAALGDADSALLPIDISADHFFANGTHSVEGMFELPTPCHEIVASASVAAGTPVPVALTLVTEKHGDICTQVITNKLWSVRFEAPEDAVITGTLDGRPIRFIWKTGDVDGAAIEKL